MSSPCERAAEKTCCSILLSIGSSTWQPAPTWSEGGEADGHAFAGAFGLPVEGLVSAELVEKDHGQEVRPSPASWGDVEGRRRLRDALARGS